MKRLLIGIALLLLCVSCTVQEAHLVYRPEPTPAATAAPVVTPTPKALLIPAVSYAHPLPLFVGYDILNSIEKHHETHDQDHRKIYAQRSGYAKDTAEHYQESQKKQ